MKSRVIKVRGEREGEGEKEREGEKEGEGERERRKIGRAHV